MSPKGRRQERHGVVAQYRLPIHQLRKNDLRQGISKDKRKIVEACIGKRKLLNQLGILVRIDTKYDWLTTLIDVVRPASRHDFIALVIIISPIIRHAVHLIFRPRLDTQVDRFRRIRILHLQLEIIRLIVEALRGEDCQLRRRGTLDGELHQVVVVTRPRTQLPIIVRKVDDRRFAALHGYLRRHTRRKLLDEYPAVTRRQQ